MTDDRSLERAARSWIEAGPTQAPDRAVERALLLIQTTSQERDLRIPRRFTNMPTPVRVAAAAGIGALLIGGAFIVTRPGPGIGSPSSSPPPTASPVASESPGAITNYRDVEGWIVFEHFGQAPDGSTTTMDFDRRMIWLVKADGTGLHELAPGAPADGKASPDISPDGTKVLFESWKPRNLVWEVSIEGGDPRLISTDCSGLETECLEGQPAYSPDGKRIAFIRSADGLQTSAVAIRDLASGQVTTLSATSVPGAEGYVAQPTWSPDGTQLAYHVNTQSTSDERPSGTVIMIVNVDGTEVRQLPSPPGEAYAGDPDWSPDGSRIVFSTSPFREGEGIDGFGSWGIWTIRPDGTDLQQACGDCLGGGDAPTWTPDGAHIMFWGYRTWAMMDPDGGNQAHINQQDLTWFGEQLGYGYFGLLQPVP